MLPTTPDVVPPTGLWHNAHKTLHAHVSLLSVRERHAGQRHDQAALKHIMFPYLNSLTGTDKFYDAKHAPKPGQWDNEPPNVKLWTYEDHKRSLRKHSIYGFVNVGMPYDTSKVRRLQSVTSWWSNIARTLICERALSGSLVQVNSACSLFVAQADVYQKRTTRAEVQFHIKFSDMNVLLAAGCVCDMPWPLGGLHPLRGTCSHPPPWPSSVQKQAIVCASADASAANMAGSHASMTLWQHLETSYSLHASCFSDN